MENTTKKTYAEKNIIKLHPILIMFILKYCSNKEHPLNPPKIVDYLQSITSIVPDVKTVTRCLHSLYNLLSMKDLHEKNQHYLANIYNLAFGGTICKSDTQLNYYYFVPSIKALSPPNIYTTGSDLTELLTASAQMKNPQTALDNTKVMYFIDTLYRAIISKTKVSVTSLEYKTSRPPLRQIAYTALPSQEDLNPYALFWHNGKYYLLATKADTPKPLHIRIDHILEIETSQTARDAIPDFLAAYFDSDTGNFLSNKYTEASPYLLGNTEKYIPNDIFLKDLTEIDPETDCKLECRDDALDLLIDTFGASNLQIADSPILHNEDIAHIIQPANKYYTVKITNVQFHSLLEFCLQYSHLVSVFQPPSLVGAIYLSLWDDVSRYTDIITNLLYENHNSLDGLTAFLNAAKCPDTD